MDSLLRINIEMAMIVMKGETNVLCGNLTKLQNKFKKTIVRMNIKYKRNPRKKKELTFIVFLLV